MNQAVYSPLRVLYYMVFILFTICTFMFILSMSMEQHYATQANTVITRSAGLTKNSYDQLNNLSNRAYWDMYHVSVQPKLNNANENSGNGNGLGNTPSDNYDNRPVQYGQPIHYYIYAHVPYDFGHHIFNNWNGGLGQTATASSRDQQ